MGRCGWKITKGSKKGSTCNIYTTKKYEGKHYCASHYKMICVLNEPEEKEEEEIEIYGSEEEEEEPKKIKKQVKNPEIKPKKNKKIIVSEELESPETVKPNLDSHSVDDIIDYEFKEIVKKEKSKNNIDVLTDKVNYLTERFNLIFPPDFEKQLNKRSTARRGKTTEIIVDDLPKLESWKK